MGRLVEESNRSRRIVGQLVRGQDLYRALLAVCQERDVRCAQVQIQGVVDEAELACYVSDDRAMGKGRKLSGTLQLLSASGIVAEYEGQLHLELSVIAARDTDNGLQMVGGICNSARVIACQFVMDSLEDLLLRRGLDRSSGLILLQQGFSDMSHGASAAGPVTASGEGAAAPGHPGSACEGSSAGPVAGAGISGTAVRSTSSAEETLASSAGSGGTWTGSGSRHHDTERDSARGTGKVSWADAVMASVHADADGDSDEILGDDNFRPVKAGDLLDHQKFGRCEVQRVDADQEYVTVRLRNSRLVRLNLEVLNLRYSGEEDGRQLFSTKRQANSS